MSKAIGEKTRKVINIFSWVSVAYVVFIPIALTSAWILHQQAPKVPEDTTAIIYLLLMACWFLVALIFGILLILKLAFHRKEKREAKIWVNIIMSILGVILLIPVTISVVMNLLGVGY